jgi:hypothetical protein
VGGGHRRSLCKKESGDAGQTSIAEVDGFHADIVRHFHCSDNEIILQLNPECQWCQCRFTRGAQKKALAAFGQVLDRLVLQAGFEPAAPGLGILSSIHLSYWSNFKAIFFN